MIIEIKNKKQKIPNTSRVTRKLQESVQHDTGERINIQIDGIEYRVQKYNHIIDFQEMHKGN